MLPGVGERGGHLGFEEHAMERHCAKGYRATRGIGTIAGCGMRGRDDGSGRREMGD